MLHLLYDSCFPHFLTLLFVLTNEALDENVLVADTPTLIYNNSHKHQHHYDKGGGYGNGENNCYIHMHCLFEFVCKIRQSSGNNSPTVGKKSLKTRKRQNLYDLEADTEGALVFVPVGAKHLEAANL